MFLLTECETMNRFADLSPLYFGVSWSGILHKWSYKINEPEINSAFEIVSSWFEVLNIHDIIICYIAAAIF